MKVFHDEDKFLNLVDSLYNVHDDIHDLGFKIDDISDMLNRMNLQGASKIVSVAVEDLESNLIYGLKEELADLIENLEKGNDTVVETDSSIKNKID